MQQLITDIDDKVLNFSKHNIDRSKMPKKGQTIFSHQVAPSRLKQEVVKLEDSLARYADICENRNSFAMGLAERS